MAKKGHKFSAGRPIKIGDTIYESVSKAALALNVDPDYIKYRMMRRYDINGMKGEYVDEIAKREFAKLDENVGLPQ